MTGQPSGTATFLFTDIEGSNKRWERQPEAMAKSVARHDEIMRAAILQHNSHVFKTVGDAFRAVFPSAEEALGASVDAQKATADEPSGEIGPIRVRMGIAPCISFQCWANRYRVPGTGPVPRSRCRHIGFRPVWLRIPLAVLPLPGWAANTDEPSHLTCALGARRRWKLNWPTALYSPSELSRVYNSPNSNSDAKLCGPRVAR